MANRSRTTRKRARGHASPSNNRRAERTPAEPTKSGRPNDAPGRSPGATPKARRPQGRYRLHRATGPGTAGRLEDYALIGDCETAALVARDGSIDWLCWPRFDGGACFAALLGTPEHGRWQIAPVDPKARVTRRYRDDTLILETDFETGDGAVTLIDFMPPRGAGVGRRPHRRRSTRSARDALRARPALRLRRGSCPG